MSPLKAHWCCGLENLRQGFRACGMLDEQGYKIEKGMCIVLAQFERGSGGVVDAGQKRSGFRSSMVRDYEHIPDDATRARFLGKCCLRFLLPSHSP